MKYNKIISILLAGSLLISMSGCEKVEKVLPSKSAITQTTKKDNKVKKDSEVSKEEKVSNSTDTHENKKTTKKDNAVSKHETTSKHTTKHETSSSDDYDRNENTQAAAYKAGYRKGYNRGYDGRDGNITVPEDYKDYSDTYINGYYDGLAYGLDVYESMKDSSKSSSTGKVKTYQADDPDIPLVTKRDDTEETKLSPEDKNKVKVVKEKPQSTDGTDMTEHEDN